MSTSSPRLKRKLKAGRNPSSDSIRARGHSAVPNGLTRPFHEPMIGERAAALEHHVLVQAEPVGQLLWGTRLSGQGFKALSKRGVVKEQQGNSEASNARAGPSAISGRPWPHALTPLPQPRRNHPDPFSWEVKKGPG